MHSSAFLGLAGFAAPAFAGAIGSELQKRDCEPLPQGHGTVPTDDTPEAFSAWPEYASTAQAAATPASYSKAFGPKKASSNGRVYMGTDVLETYDPAVCAATCETKQGCAGFDIFFERAPSQNPAAGCPNPPSTTLIKCNYWGYPVTEATATQDGQWRNDFHVLISGANGYNKDAATNLQGFKTTALNNAAIRSPEDCNGKESYVTVKTFPGDSPFDARRCAQACKDETQFNKDHLGGRATCRFFNLFLKLKNGQPYEQVCTLYTQAWTASYADNTGEWRDGDHYTIAYSYSFADTTNAFLEPICPSDLSQLNSPENVEFCAAYIGYVPPQETSRVAGTVSTIAHTTVTEVETSTPPPVTVTSTDISSGVTTVVVATEHTTTTVIAANALKRREVATPTLVASWLPEKISAACSKVATFTSTTTQTTATETLYTATEATTSTDISVAPTPITTLITTSPLISTVTITTTLITTTVSRPVLEQPQCNARPIRLCCLNIAPWSTNSAVWGGICGYTPTNPSELVGARCIHRPASGQCPSGTSQACCKGTIPGQCALGTQCARA